MDKTISVPITANNLPEGPRWESDGACWRAVSDEHCGAAGWRWRPENAKALGKDAPDGPMQDYFPSLR